MSPPVVRVNTFIEEKKDTHIKLDRTSKIFMLTELLCGINRLWVFPNIKPTFLALSFIFSFSVNIAVIYLTCYKFSQGTADYLEILKLFQYCICALLAFVCRKRLSDFYSELSAFDRETNFGGGIKDVIKNVAQGCLTVGFTILLFIILHILDIFEQYTVEVIVILLVHVAEVHFFGHLLSVLIPRLRFIRHLMKVSFDVSRVTTIENDYIKNDKHPDMRQLMDCYHRIIVAFDKINDAVKWQLTQQTLSYHIGDYASTIQQEPFETLAILVTTFISTLSLSYHISLQLIRNEYVVTNVLVNLTLTLIEMVPMFAPCRIVDTVHNEARRLIELLSSMLYENKIEKSSRTVAQALLALMEARDLSFSLLRLFDIDVSFPFKFLGLLVTYLIILLQFEKVINLDRPTI